MADCDIFREHLAIKYPSYGHALWEPSPRCPDKPVQVGDVGFIRRGKFHRLFNALLPENDPTHERGVPEYHEPLVPNLLDHLDKGTLARNHYCSPGVNIEADPGFRADPDDIKEVTFKYDRTRGAAVLSLPVAAQREDTLAQGDFKSWIVKNIDSWFAFAQKLGLGIERMEDIILVTGCDLTKSWANIAFFGNQADSQVSFGVEVKGEDPDITFQFSPENAGGALLHHGPEGKNLLENQCVFIRGFRAARTFWILPKRLKAAAGPSSGPSGYDCDPDMEVMSIPATTKYRDPLYLLLDYIAEQASDCDMVLAHDDDLMKIDGLGHDSSLETLEPDVMTDILRRSNIEIHQVPFVSRTDSGLNTDSNTSIVKVAMLSMKSQNLDSDTGPQSQGPPFELNIDLSSDSESHIPGSFPVPTIQGHTSGFKTSLHDGGVNSVLQDLRRLKHATEHIVLVLGKIRNELSNIWSSLGKFAHVGRNTLMTAVVVIACAVSLLGWAFSFTWVVIFKLFFMLLLASLPAYLLFECEYRYRLQLDERLESIQQCVVSLQSRPTVSTHFVDRVISYPIMAKEAPSNPGRLGQNMQDVVEPVVSGPSNHSEPLENSQRASERDVLRSRQDEEELQILRERCERLEEERILTADPKVPKLVEQLRADMADLIANVSNLSRRNDKLVTPKDSDLTVIRDLDAQLKDYKLKYKQAKTELLSVKATSALFLEKPRFDELPISANGAILDVHFTAFLTGIDSLLSAGRSNSRTRVLTSMRSVVNAGTTILDDVRSHSLRYSDPEGVHALEERVETTLSYLTAASKTHATSLGHSPVSFLDAVASHVSAAVTELGRVVFLRRATKAEQEKFAPSSTANATSGFTPSLRTVEEVRPSVNHQRGLSESSRRSEREREPMRNEWEQVTHESSSDDSSSAAPTIFDQRAAKAAGLTSLDSATAEGSENAWTELTPYLEAQTESIIYAIQRVLSSLRSPTPSTTADLNENLTQIITIVSSIVAVCHDNLPASQARHGGGILRELSEYADKLSEMQALPEVTKESRQVMARSSFAIANAMKALEELWPSSSRSTRPWDVM